MDEREKILEIFLEKWPISNLHNLTLREYALGDKNFKDTFSYWVETETKSLGDLRGIGGGGSFKHGIYFMSIKKEFDGNQYMDDGEFAWLAKYGDNVNSAFEKIKSLLLEVVKAAQKNDWEAIDKIDFYPPVKWKWAFLYSNKNLFTVYKKEALEVAAHLLGYKNEDESFPALYKFITSKKKVEETCFDLGRRVWKLYEESKSQANGSTLVSSAMRKKHPINQILFGPPGTGKTFNTINLALEICGEDLNGLSRSEVKALFEDKLEKEQIVFTTFHQSMTYEDFVEGIKPIEPEKEGDPVIYKVEEGIFRRLCIEASFALAKENGVAIFDWTLS